MKRLCLAAFVAALVAGPALADSAGTANAAMDALSRGDNQGAINLFTQAIAAGDLSTDDQESAYVERGQAYLNLGAYDQAAADFRTAMRLKPSDDAAMNGLQQSMNAKAQAQAQAQVQQAPPPAQEEAPPPLSGLVLNGVWEFHLCGEMSKAVGHVNIFNATETSASMSGGVRTSPLDIQAFKSINIKGVFLTLHAKDGGLKRKYYGKIVSPTRIESWETGCNWYGVKQ